MWLNVVYLIIYKLVLGERQPVLTEVLHYILITILSYLHTHIQHITHSITYTAYNACNALHTTKLYVYNLYTIHSSVLHSVLGYTVLQSYGPLVSPSILSQ